MKKKTLQLTPQISTRINLILVFVLLFGFSKAQQATVSGQVIDEFQFPLMDVEVTDGSETVYTDTNGKYSLNVESGTDVTLHFEQQGRVSYTETVHLEAGENRDLHVMMAPDTQSVLLGEAVIFQKVVDKPLNSISFDPRTMETNIGITGGVVEMIGSLPSVSVGSELTSQYRVRGGNYDENLIYVNGIEIYKPQLIRSGEQEGLGFVNPTMTDAVNFSAGGWEPKYGDKMSSVLDIIYKRPKSFEGTFEASLMGGSLTLGTASKNQKFSAIVGGRYQNRDLVLNTLDSNSDLNPVYYDVQANLNYRFNSKWDISFLGAITDSKFEMKPRDRETKFGTLDNPMSLKVFYDGNEEDRFATETASLSLHHKPNSKLDLVVDAFGFHSKEQEYFDIYGAYLINELDGDGNAISTYDIGSQIDHARNNLDALVMGIQHRGKYKFDVNNDIEWGLKFQREDIRDMLSEWQYLDSTGYSIPNIYHPGELDNGDLILNYSVHAKNKLESNRYAAFAQYTKKFFWGKSKVLVNGGVRATYWDFNEEWNISPRAQIAIKPDWKKTDMTFRFNTGLYYQPPFYREVRDLNGNLNKDVKAQQSIHFILGNDYEFKMWERDFKMTTEAYYKIFNDLNPYFVDNVRIRYTADNNSKGYGYGLDFRLFGQFVEGVDSWLSLSYARAYQNIDNRGDIPLPTDPRFKASIFFQDYMPILPSFKVNVNLVYASGLPNGAPPMTDPYDYTSYLTDYKRVDIGFIKEIINQDDLKAKGNFWGKFKELSIGLDVFNIFDIRNEISNTWVRDVNSSRIYGVPNRLTGRFLNAKIRMKF
ncbi:MAG: TonB-dependent receptor [Moheibacter sp.]